MDLDPLTMHPRLSLAVAAIALCLPAQALAADERAFNVPKGSLSSALPLISRQAGVSISVADAKLWQARVKPVRGRMSVEKAIQRLLDGSDARAVRVSATSWRIERRPAPARVAKAAAAPRPVPQPRAREPANDLIAAARDEIIVTASKTDLPHSHFAGVVTRLDGDDLAFGGERGMDSILSRTATVSSTHLGSGRNKLFIRGIADSSFTGPTQSTVGQYFGDIRLSYNAPDPDLRLYDIDNVEILEGPQGTLYGAGSLGGIIHVVPKAPDPRAMSVQAIAGLSVTQHGDPGGDIAAIANLPVGDNGHALRLVGYMLTDGGYIDNPLRGQNDVNRVHVRGGRGTFRLEAGDGWTVDFGGIYQAITSDDAQYADKDAPPLTRASMVEQNATARYGMGTIVVMKDWGDLYFQSSNAFIDHRLFERFDASLPESRRGDGDGAGAAMGAVDVERLFAPVEVVPMADVPRVLDQHNDTRMFVSENRLSRPYHDGLGWVVGASFIHNRARQDREYAYGPLSAVLPGVTNRITEVTGYAEATVEIMPNLIASGGLRLSHARLGGEAEGVSFALAEANRATTASRNETDLLPSVSLLATPLDNVRLYARYQEGFRPGGLAVDGNFVRRFLNDQVRTWEAGMRFGDKGRSLLDASISVSHSRWRNIQADFIDSSGFPTTANIGNGRITSLSGAVAMRPTDALTFELGAVYNHSRVDDLSPQILPVFAAAPARLGRIPNVASHAVRGSVNYATMIGDEDFRVNGWANYIGPSRLGIGPVLGESQGDYVDTGLAMRVGNNRRGLSLTLTNLFDSRGNRFSLGTPFLEGNEGFLTPLRPRTLRIAVDVAY
ncbi:TonB-dependent receptor [Sphingopyxis sp. SE2]|jgi:outer membrane receptor protein involved in Fe transport|uniref:TonB-dependent receptor domain-containing protein n=1 Tax=unclassified Sphingopyxis TaxID=2614943 RepID=UPI00050DB15B|nr:MULTISPECIES: TonB-dependent receptor [unclassified Sphingopyxis]KGB57321.1 TonB-dependent receptor precursor [Sphingopyxis sp. LC363]MDT7528012.1 TonB-dependent receptor [Sphingopyxis sp. SE2]